MWCVCGVLLSDPFFLSSPPLLPRLISHLSVFVLGSASHLHLGCGGAPRATHTPIHLVTWSMAPPTALSMSSSSPQSGQLPLDDYKFTFEAYLDDSARIEADVSSRHSRTHPHFESPSRLTVHSFRTPIHLHMQISSLCSQLIQAEGARLG